jgi:hypothetical protein
MTVLEWVATWWRQATPRPQRQTSIVAPPRPKPRVQAEYMSLYTYLEHRYATTVVLTFEQMESLLGFTLPAPASTERDWWDGAPDSTKGHSEAWTAARRMATPNLAARTVTFERLP